MELIIESQLKSSFINILSFYFIIYNFLKQEKNPRASIYKNHKFMEIFEVGPCKSSYQMGYEIGKRFSSLINSRLAKDLILHNQLRPFAKTQLGQTLVDSLSANNKNKFPQYWDELIGTAEGSGVPVIEIILINFRKEILAFIPKNDKADLPEDTANDCSDVLVVSHSMAIAAHNEDANVALVGHTYLIKAHLGNGHSFTAYTYAGELPSCAFGFNNQGLAFTLDSVPPREEEIVAGGIGRNFISRDLLEASNIGDALQKIQSQEVSVGHSYNLIDILARKILNVETASRNRLSIYEINATPFFHANMYLHLQVPQMQDPNSKSRQERAASLQKESKDDFLSILGDTEDKIYPIYMTGPTLYTLCTVVVDLDGPTLSIIEGNPKEGNVVHLFHM